MKAVVVGCGRVGAGIADELDRAGGRSSSSMSLGGLRPAPGPFGGTALRGDGTDEDVLRRAGAENADLFLALTEGDNRNIMAAQLGVEALAARKTVAKINDPVRAEAYAHLGIATMCRTNLMTGSILGYAGQASRSSPGVFVPVNPHHHEEGLGDPAVPATPGTSTTPSTPAVEA